MRALVFWRAAQEDPEASSILEEGLRGLVDLRWASSREEALKFLGEVEIYIGGAQNWVLEKGERLRLLQAVHAGVDGIDLELARRRGVVVASAKGANALYVAETAVALMLSLVKRITLFDRMAKAGVFPPYSKEYSTESLRGRKVVILGYGSIGREIARLLRPFGPRIVGVKKRSPPGDQYAEAVAGLEELEHHLGDADFLVIALPLTPETKGLVGERILSRMKRGSYLVNVGRGGVVDEKALKKALEDGRIAGAALDVWWRYPGEGGEPYSSEGIHRMEQVVATPHRAGFSRDALIEVARFVVSNVRRFVEGEELAGLVDLERGY